LTDRGANGWTGAVLTWKGAIFSAARITSAKKERVFEQYLADLAASNGMKLATLDEGISHQAVELIV
jgi:hypothetical protein